jgi:hypothetical protein
LRTDSGFAKAKDGAKMDFINGLFLLIGMLLVAAVVIAWLPSGAVPRRLPASGKVGVVLALVPPVGIWLSLVFC